MEMTAPAKYQKIYKTLRTIMEAPPVEQEKITFNRRNNTLQMGILCIILVKYL
jgi:hypothetical protein